jgi:hypothetical protein
MRPITDPGANFFQKSPMRAQRKKKEAKKKERGGLWKLPQPLEIASGCLRRHFLDDFHRCLEKPTQKRCGFPTVTTGPTTTNHPREIIVI